MMAVRSIPEEGGDEHAPRDIPDPFERGTLDLLWARRRLLAICGALLGAVVLVVTLVLPAKYVASASFVAQQKAQTSSLTNIAAQFGVNLGAGAAGSESPQFYVDLVTSPTILRIVADTPVHVHQGAGTGLTTVAALYGGDASTAEGREHVVELLQRNLAAVANPKTSVVTLRVTSRDPIASQEIAHRCLALLNSFNLRRRRTQATAEREFAAQQLAAAERDLRAAENQLQMFLESNRGADGAPRLRFEQDRLTRAVSTQQQLYTSLSQAYEQARLEEVRDTPVITVIEDPVVPARAESRGTVPLTLFAILFGVFLGAAYVLVADWSERGIPVSADE